MNRKLKVLLIDDDEQIHEIVKSTLTEDEFDVVSEYNARDGLKQVLRFNPDLILLDYILPEVSGMDTLRELKGHLITKNIPVIIMSSAGNQSIIESFYKLGAIDFIDKPLTPRILREKIRSLATSLRLLAQSGQSMSGNIIGFFGVKGGVGTSTIASNLALMLSREITDTSKKLLLMDLDQNSSALSSFYDVKEGKLSLLDLLKEHPFDLDREYLFSSIAKVTDNFYLLPSANRVGHFHAVEVDELSTMMLVLGNVFDYIVIDMDRSFSDVNLFIFEHANLLNIVTNTTRQSLYNLQGIVNTFQKISIDKKKLGLVLNDLDRTDKINGKDLLLFSGIPCISTFKKYPEKYFDAEERRIPVAALTRSPTTAEYKKFAEKLIEIFPVEAQKLTV